jgi:uncharacterized protein
MLSSILGQSPRKTILLLSVFCTGGGRSFPPQRLRPAGLLNFLVAVLLFPVMAVLTVQTAVAQSSRASQRPTLTGPQLQQILQKKHNEAALLLLGGLPGTTYSNIAHDIAAAVSRNEGLRVIAVDAPGGMESLRDLLLLRGVDLALVPENVLDYADATAAFGQGLRDRLTYVTALYGEEIHILVGPGVTSITELAGKKVAVSPGDGNADFTIRDLLRRLHIEAEVVKVAAADAIDDVRSGALAALVVMGGKPLRFISSLPKDGSLGLLAVPSMQALGDGYSPSSFGAEDYPALIPGGQIDTVSVSAIIVANKTALADDPNRRIARFVPAFFSSLSDLTGQHRHPKWGEVNLAATVAKWPRFPAAKDWLDTALREQSASVRRDFEEFLRINNPAGVSSPAARKQLFEEYLRWTRSTPEAHR